MEKGGKIMGLDFSHCNAHWSYSGFSKFRARIAKEIRITLGKMEGFMPCGLTPEQKENWPQREWDKVDDPIVNFLAHSDCDGMLTPGQCRIVAPRLRELVASWPDDDWDKIQALELAEGMDLAGSCKENLRFH